MSTVTANYNLTKPIETETADIQIINNNMDILDTTLKAQSNKITAINADRIYYGGTSTGSGNAYAITIDSSIISYAEPLAISFKANYSSTGSTTINVNGLGAKAIKKANGNNVTNLIAGSIYTMRYNGSNFILQGEGGSGTAIASDILLGKTASADVGDIVGTIPSKATATYTPTTGDQVIAAGQYLSGPQTVKGDTNLLTTNIKSGVSIFGVSGKSSVVDTADATAVAGNILNQITAYVNGTKVTGTATVSSLGGKLYASSTVTSSSGTISVTTTGNYALSRATVSVTGLTFTPSRIKVKYAASADSMDVAEYDSSISGNLSGAINIFSMQTSGSVSGYNIKQDANVKVTTNGFVFPVSYSNAVYTWEAYA